MKSEKSIMLMTENGNQLTRQNHCWYTDWRLTGSVAFICPPKRHE